MKKMILFTTLLFGLSVASDTVIPPEKRLVEIVKKQALIVKKYLKPVNKQILQLEDIKIKDKKVIFIYKMKVSEELFKFTFENKNKIKDKVLKKLKLKFSKMKLDPMLYLVKKYNYSIVYHYYLASNPKKYIDITITKKELFD